MRVLMAVLASLCLSGAALAAAADPLTEARRLYNLGDYDAAARYAREALRNVATADGARLVLGRVHLELYRQTADQADLVEAREALKSIDATALDDTERVELLVGLGQHLFLEDRYGIASESFERAIDSSTVLGPAAHERVLDWWATALDRLALSRPRDARQGIYARIVARMETELASDPSSGPAAYWLPAALRGSGELDRAWDTARAGWITAMIGRDYGAALRADLDRLTLQGIIPERAMRLQPREPATAGGVMRSEWEALKARWSR